MSRWKFLLGLWGGGAAAQMVTPGRIDNFHVSQWRVMNPWPENEKPVNNECPVCGTMAPKYSKAETLARFLATAPECSEKFRSLARCIRCNAAFWQDAS